MERWQSGDIEAYESLFGQYHQRVFRTAYLLTGSEESVVLGALHLVGI